MDQELLNKDNQDTKKYKYRTNRKQLNNLIRDEKILRWIRNENSKNIERITDVIDQLIHKIKVPVRPNRHYQRWGRIITQGKPMRFRLDGRSWPNSTITNGKMITVCPT